MFPILEGHLAVSDATLASDVSDSMLAALGCVVLYLPRLAVLSLAHVGLVSATHSLQFLPTFTFKLLMVAALMMHAVCLTPASWKVSVSEERCHHCLLLASCYGMRLGSVEQSWSGSILFHARTVQLVVCLRSLLPEAARHY